MQVHLDVMDGHFVPNLSWGAPIIKCLKPHCKAFFDVHLMVSEPHLWVQDMKVSACVFVATHAYVCVRVAIPERYLRLIACPRYAHV